MNVVLLSERILISKDWATVLFILALVIIAANKTVFEVRFNEFIRIGISDKYHKIYKDTSNLLNWFTVSMFVIQLISFSFFILLLLSYFGYSELSNYITFIQIITFLFVFILSKFLIEKIIGNTLNAEGFVDQFNLVKVNYRAFFGLLLLPINIILYYNHTPLQVAFYIILAVFVIYNLITYYFLIKTYQKLILGKLFYFILYLCTLEIAPYYFMYYWITKK